MRLRATGKKALFPRIRIRAVRHALVVAAAVAWVTVPLAEEPRPALRTQLRELAQLHQFAVHDLSRIDDAAPGKAVHGSLREQLKQLLEDYSYVVLSSGAGSISEVRIMGSTGATLRGAQSPALRTSDARETTFTEDDSTSANEDSASSEYRIGTRRDGSRHTIYALLVGREGKGARLSLDLDLEGTAIVLPASKSSELGFDLDELEDGWIDTERGGFVGKLATLRMVRLADVLSRNVAVTFVEDRALGGHMLFGVKALTEFSAALDEMENEIVFVRK